MKRGGGGEKEAVEKRVEGGKIVSR